MEHEGSSGEPRRDPAFEVLTEVDACAAMRRAHEALVAAARADGLLCLRRAGGSWTCERFGAELTGDSCPGDDLLSAPEGRSLQSWDGFGPGSPAAWDAWLHSLGASAYLATSLRVAGHMWFWVLVRRAPVPIAAAEREAALAALRTLGPALALRSVVEDAEATREQLALVLRHSADAILVVDRDHRIRVFNDAARRLFGYTPGEVLGQDYDLLVPPELRGRGESDRIKQAVERNGTVQDQECVRWSKEGKVLTLRMTSAAIRVPEGAVVSRFSFIRDVRTVRKLQEELVRSQSLAIVGELAASVAHEIRNPLASISAAIETLERELPMGEEQKQTTRRILAQIQRLDDTVERLLIFAKPWEVAAQDYDLASLLQGLAASLRRLADERRVRMEVSCVSPCPAHGDPQLLEHVLVNVVQNALEATPAGGRVAVAVEASATMLDLSVVDTGPGIPEEHRDKLFRPFFTTKASGTGLGLATSQKMVRAHGGGIRVETRAGEGAAVRISIPRFYRPGVA